jgi:hypothetical protein
MEPSQQTLGEKCGLMNSGRSPTTDERQADPSQADPSSGHCSRFHGQYLEAADGKRSSGAGGRVCSRTSSQ